MATAHLKAISYLLLPTPKQTDLLRNIEAHLAEHGTAPTIRELTNGKSTATIHKQLAALCKKGYLSVKRRHARSYLPTRRAFAFLAVDPARETNT